MNKINPLVNAQFPASSNTWDFVKEMILMVSRLAGLGGNNYILSGCIDNGLSVTAGYIVVNGELLPFEGGAKSDYIIIIETNTGVLSGGVNYPGIYTERTARFGSGVGQIPWSTLKSLKALDLKANAADVYTREDIDQILQNLINSAPAVLDTLKELADALGNDPNFATSIANQLANKANSADVYAKADVYTKAESDQNNGGLRTVVAQIGYWNMDSTELKQIQVASLIGKNVISVSVFIITDSGVGLYELSKSNTALPGYFFYDRANAMLYMYRKVNGDFDNNQFSSVSENRGWAIFSYLP